ncbi:bcas2 family protein [Phlyctema vagabunda]|uniref:Bcas2 family protein n=1 Tax=Phlyctema vagabunda TaxID=108571 RepID=A0ABR4PLY1_9HELO
MPLITEIHESLPYIDFEPSAAERAAALALIAAELPQDVATQTHSALPPLAESRISELMKQEYERIEAKQPLRVIDTSRYEQLEPPATSPGSDETLALWREALSKAYTSHTYLTGRQTNLALLEQFGKNSWLVGNAQLEDILRDLERELAARKQDIDVLVVERKNRQEGVAGEMRLLEENWKRGVGKVLETEVAAEELRREILEKKRAGAS